MDVPSLSQPPRRSSSRSRRSHPSFSDLRLAPLSTAADQNKTSRTKSIPSPTAPSDSITDHVYRKQHSTYLKGRSVPSSPSILSRSSSRRQIHGGLSRKNSHYDDEAENIEPRADNYAYEAVASPRTHRSSAFDAPDRRTKSEASLTTTSPRSSDSSTQVRTHNKSNRPRSSQGPSSGTQASFEFPHPRPVSRGRKSHDDSNWLLHTASFTSTLLAEGKGQAWHSGHDHRTNSYNYASTNSAHTSPSSSSSDDENTGFRTAYQSQERLSSGTQTPHHRSPLLDRRRSTAHDHNIAAVGSTGTQTWGSRFGSRAPSTHPSRRNSRTSLAALALATKQGQGQRTPAAVDAARRVENYFSIPLHTQPRQEEEKEVEVTAPDFVAQADRAEMLRSSFALDGAGSEEDEQDAYGDEDEDEIARLARLPGFGIGGFVDRIVGSVDFFDGQDGSEDEDFGSAARKEVESGSGDGLGIGGGDGRASRSRRWGGVEAVKRKDRLGEDEGEKGQGWADAAWLFSVAAKALF